MTPIAEEAIAEFIQELINAAPGDDPLFNQQLHETIYESFKADSGIRVADAEGLMSPTEGGEEAGEYDTELIVIVFARVIGTDKRERIAARRLATTIAHRLFIHFWNAPDCNGRFRDLRVTGFRRGWDNIKADPYAVVNLDVICNVVG